MRIRDLQWKGLPMWPPEWWVSDEGAGEAGLLKDVQLRTDQTPACISVVATHLGDDRNGIMFLEDRRQLETLCHKLQENIGRPLKEIGDLKIDWLLSMPKKGPKQVRPQATAGPVQQQFLPAAAPLKSRK